MEAVKEKNKNGQAPAKTEPKNPPKLLQDFLTQNNLEIKLKVVVANADVYNAIKPDLVGLVLGCVAPAYDVVEKA